MSKLALVHDYLLVPRGAERTFAAMSDIWPEAPIVTLFYDEAATQQQFSGRAVTVSPLQRLGVQQGNFRRLLPLLATAVRRLPLKGFDCVLSSSSAFAHGVQVPPGAAHVCYCHSPFRYAWHEEDQALSEVPRALRPLLGLLLRRHRGFDKRAAHGVDLYVANSQITRRRIKRFWGRDAVVVHPPVDVDRFSPAQLGDYVLFVGEMVRHKRADLAIEAALAAGRRIKLVGAGPDLPRLRSLYGDGVEFLGRVENGELARLYAGAHALVVPNIEEFGIAAVEAQAAGRPVVGADGGGLRETVVSHDTGLLVAPDNSAALARALREDFTSFDSRHIRDQAQRFARPVFQARMREIVEETCAARG